jgi:hypothetical protein
MRQLCLVGLFAVAVLALTLASLSFIRRAPEVPLNARMQAVGPQQAWTLEVVMQGMTFKNGDPMDLDIVCRDRWQRPLVQRGILRFVINAEDSGKEVFKRVINLNLHPNTGAAKLQRPFGEATNSLKAGRYIVSCEFADPYARSMKLEPSLAFDIVAAAK